MIPLRLSTVLGLLLVLSATAVESKGNEKTLCCQWKGNKQSCKMLPSDVVCKDPAPLPPSDPSAPSTPGACIRLDKKCQPENPDSCCSGICESDGKDKKKPKYYCVAPEPEPEPSSSVAVIIVPTSTQSEGSGITSSSPSSSPAASTAEASTEVTASSSSSAEVSSSAAASSSVVASSSTVASSSATDSPSSSGATPSSSAVETSTPVSSSAADASSVASATPSPTSNLCPPQAVVNPSFETSDPNDVTLAGAPWTVYASVADTVFDGKIINDASTSHSGNRFLRLNIDLHGTAGAGMAAYQNVDLTPGTTYKLSLWYRATSSSSRTSCYVGITAAGAYTATPLVYSGQWTQITRLVEAASSRLLFMDFLCRNDGAVVDLDDVTLEYVPVEDSPSCETVAPTPEPTTPPTPATSEAPESSAVPSAVSSEHPASSSEPSPSAIPDSGSPPGFNGGFEVFDPSTPSSVPKPWSTYGTPNAVTLTAGTSDSPAHSGSRFLRAASPNVFISAGLTQVIWVWASTEYELSVWTRTVFGSKGPSANMGECQFTLKAGGNSNQIYLDKTWSQTWTKKSGRFVSPALKADMAPYGPAGMMPVGVEVTMVCFSREDTGTVFDFDDVTLVPVSSLPV